MLFLLVYLGVGVNFLMATHTQGLGDLNRWQIVYLWVKLALKYLFPGWLCHKLMIIYIANESISIN